MKRALLASVVCIPLAGCFQTTGDGPPPAPDITAIFRAVVNGASSVCHFAPDFGTVAELFSLGPELQSAGSLVSAVCGAVTRPAVAVPGKPGVVVRPAPTYRGVPIRGRTV